MVESSGNLGKIFFTFGYDFTHAGTVDLKASQWSPETWKHYVLKIDESDYTLETINEFMKAAIQHFNREDNEQDDSTEGAI